MASRSMNNMRKDIPTFENEDEEREFWATHDSTEYIDWDKASPAHFPKLDTSKIAPRGIVCNSDCPDPRSGPESEQP